MINKYPGSDFPTKISPQKQDKQPGMNNLMNPKPIYECQDYVSVKKLQGKVAIITGGDSGIGRAVAIAYAKEGASVAIVFLDEVEDAEETKVIIETNGGQCILIPGDISEEAFCISAIQKTIDKFKKLDIVVNNSAVQYPQNSIEDITKEQLEKTFKTNIFSMFYITKAALRHLKEGSSIINTASITAYAGSETLLDYSSTKGAIVSFTRSLALSLVARKIRVNGVAPGPIWTPLIPASFDEIKVSEFGSDVPFKRPGQPVEVAPAYVFLASADASYMTGQVLHINGGVIING
ncbi:MAG: SDR family oxidoreductase [Clostridiaceae bacterium]|nr:SDR family oxidoreductase [Clostridiaceae bacterium]